MKKSLLIALILNFSITTLFAQSGLELQAVIPGASVSGIFVPNDSTKMDFTGDGVPDVSFFKTDAQGNVFLTIVDAADYTVWRVIQLDGEIDIFIPNTNGLKAKVIGGFELDGSNNFKEIVLAEKKGRRFVNPVAIDVNGIVLWDGTSKTLIGIANMDGDVCEEIVASDPKVPQIEVWGEKK